MYNGCLQQIEVGVRMQVKDGRRSFTMGKSQGDGRGGRGRERAMSPGQCFFCNSEAQSWAAKSDESERKEWGRPAVRGIGAVPGLETKLVLIRQSGSQRREP